MVELPVMMTWNLLPANMYIQVLCLAGVPGDNAVRMAVLSTDILRFAVEETIPRPVVGFDGLS
jgi:hypothetical protein